MVECAWGWKIIALKSKAKQIVSNLLLIYSIYSTMNNQHNIKWIKLSVYIHHNRKYLNQQEKHCKIICLSACQSISFSCFLYPPSTNILNIWMWHPANNSKKIKCNYIKKWVDYFTWCCAGSSVDLRNNFHNWPIQAFIWNDCAVCCVLCVLLSFFFCRFFFIFTLFPFDKQPIVDAVGLLLACRALFDTHFLRNDGQVNEQQSALLKHWQKKIEWKKSRKKLLFSWELICLNFENGFIEIWVLCLIVSVKGSAPPTLHPSTSQWFSIMVLAHPLTLMH